MDDSVGRLLHAYRRELELYEGILRLAQEGVSAISAGEPLTSLHRVNLEKNRLLHEVEELEASIDADKDVWRRRGRAGAGNSELERVLARLTDLIEAILESERETDRWILEGTGAAGCPAATV